MKHALLGFAAGCGVTGAVLGTLLFKVTKYSVEYSAAVREANAHVMADAFKYLTDEQIEEICTNADFRAIAISADPKTKFNINPIQKEQP